MGYHAADAIDEAIDATRSRLFPLSGWLWTRIAVITLFLGGGLGVPTQFLNVPTTSFGESGPAPDIPTTAAADPEIGATVLLAGGLLVAGVALLWSVASATMQFVFIDALRTPDRSSVRLIGPFFDRLGAGVRLFGFQLVTGLVALIPLVVLGAFVVSTVTADGGIAVGTVPLAVGGVLAVAVFLVVGLIQSLTVQLVVPVMVATSGTVLGSWRTLWPSLREQAGETVVYVLLRVLLGLGVGIVNSLLSVLLLIPVVLIAAVIGALFGGLTMAVVGNDAGLLVGGITGGLVGIVGSIVAVLGVSVLTKTYLRVYELASLAGIDGRFDLLPDGEATGAE